MASKEEYNSEYTNYRIETAEAFKCQTNQDNVMAAKHFREAAQSLAKVIEWTTDANKRKDLILTFKDIIKEADRLDPYKGNVVNTGNQKQYTQDDFNKPADQNNNNNNNNQNNYPVPPTSSNTAAEETNERKYAYKDRQDGDKTQLTKDDVYNENEKRNPFYNKASVLKQMSIKESLAELNKMIGLKQVKSEVMEAIKLAKAEYRRSQLNLKKADLSFHATFVGSPGTGKSSVAKILGQIYYAAGILQTPKFMEIDHQTLESKFIGESAENVESIVQLGMGGMIFIDEAYGLTPNKEGNSNETQKVITKLMAVLEKYHDKLVVVFAGYEDEIKELIKSNPGFQSRIKTEFHFKDFSKDELFAILLKFCNDTDFKIEKDAVRPIKFIINELIRRKESDPEYDFGNARSMRGLCQDIYGRLSVRTSEIEKDDPEEQKKLLSTFTKEDVLSVMKKEEYNLTYIDGPSLDEDKSSKDETLAKLEKIVIVDDSKIDFDDDIKVEDDKPTEDEESKDVPESDGPNVPKEPLFSEKPEAVKRRETISQFLMDAKNSDFAIEVKPDIDLHELIKSTEGLSYEDLEKVLDEVTSIYMSRSFHEANHEKYLCKADFDEAIKTVKDQTNGN